MQVSIKVIRSLGFNKILGSFDTEVLDSIRYQNTRYFTEGVKAYSFLAMTNRESCPVGMKAIYNYLSITKDTEIDNRKKREFKNYWNSIWTSFGQATDLDESTVSALSLFGLKLQLLLLDKEYSPSVEVLNFYNQVLLWGVFCQEKNINESVEGIRGVMNDLVFADKDAFLEKLRGYLNV